MVNRVRCLAAVLVAVAVIGGGCSSGPKRLSFDRPLPSCSAFVATLTAQGMPDPQALPNAAPSGAGSGFDCNFSAPQGTRPPAVAVVTMLVSRPTYVSDEKDPAKRFGQVYVAKDGCAGVGADNAALPAGSSCAQLRGPHAAAVTVTSFAQQSAIRVTLDWSDDNALPEQLRSDALDKANAVAESIIGML
jgi:hypothetical protein